MVSAELFQCAQCCGDFGVIVCLVSYVPQLFAAVGVSELMPPGGGGGDVTALATDGGACDAHGRFPSVVVACGVVFVVFWMGLELVLLRLVMVLVRGMVLWVCWLVVVEVL